MHVFLYFCLIATCILVPLMHPFSLVYVYIHCTCVLFHKFTHLLFAMSQSASDKCMITPKWHETDKKQLSNHRANDHRSGVLLYKSNHNINTN